jgi:hypothetical protein
MPTVPLVFLGPTLPQKEAAALLAADFRGPARRGDIYRALFDGYRTIVLIDGEFHGAPSVWQREVVDALAEGAAVHGASSMGALRAAELHGLGMIGHGRIFQWYRDGVLDADDEVALIYGPAELGYPSLSEPLVNIRATLELAVPNIMSYDAFCQLVAEAKATYFPERSFDALLASDIATGWPSWRRDALAKLVAERRVDQKRLDAVAALMAVAINPGDRLVGSEIPVRSLWEYQRLVAEGFASGNGAVDAAAIRHHAGLSADELAALRRELSAVFFAAEWARECGLTPTNADIACERQRCGAAIVDSGRRVAPLLERLALARRAAWTFAEAVDFAGSRPGWRTIVLDWAARNGISHGDLVGDALADWVIDAGPAHFGYRWLFEADLVAALHLQGRGARLGSADLR